MASLSSKRSIYKGTEIMTATVVPPDSAANLTTTDSVIYQIVLCNTTGTAATITITDKNTTPLDICNAFSVAAHVTTVLNFQEGVLMKGGINWVQGTTNALNAQIFGVKL